MKNLFRGIELHPATNIKKSRRNYICQKCKCEIQEGEYYIRIHSKLMPDVIRCIDCGATRYDINKLMKQYLGV